MESWQDWDRKTLAFEFNFNNANGNADAVNQSVPSLRNAVTSCQTHHDVPPPLPSPHDVNSSVPRSTLPLRTGRTEPPNASRTFAASPMARPARPSSSKRTGSIPMLRTTAATMRNRARARSTKRRMCARPTSRGVAPALVLVPRGAPDPSRAGTGFRMGLAGALRRRRAPTRTQA